MHRINISEATEKICEEFKHKILSHQLLGAARFTYPFLIEFALIGASVAYIMSNHIGKRFLICSIVFVYKELFTWLLLAPVYIFNILRKVKSYF